MPDRIQFDAAEVGFTLKTEPAPYTGSFKMSASKDEVYEAAKALDREIVAAAQRIAIEQGHQDYREFMTPLERALDEAIQRVEDKQRSYI